MPSPFFCPHCWREIADTERRCRVCSYDLHDDTQLPYEVKRINALGHPIRENVMIAAQVPGNFRSVKSLPAFEAIIRNENDFILIREIACALRKIDTAENLRVVDFIHDHPLG